MHVPKAAVHKKRDPPLGKNDIGDSGQVFPVQPETITRLEKDATYKHLWLGVLSPYSRHHSAADQCIDYIRHNPPRRASGISMEGAENGRENMASRHSGRFAHSEIILPLAVS